MDLSHTHTHVYAANHLVQPTYSRRVHIFAATATPAAHSQPTPPTPPTTAPLSNLSPNPGAVAFGFDGMRSPGGTIVLFCGGEGDGLGVLVVEFPLEDGAGDGEGLDVVGSELPLDDVWADTLVARSSSVATLNPRKFIQLCYGREAILNLERL